MYSSECPSNINIVDVPYLGIEQKSIKWMRDEIAKRVSTSTVKKNPYLLLTLNRYGSKGKKLSNGLSATPMPPACAFADFLLKAKFLLSSSSSSASISSSSRYLFFNPSSWPIKYESDN